VPWCTRTPFSRPLISLITFTASSDNPVSTLESYGRIKYVSRGKSRWNFNAQDS